MIHHSPRKMRVKVAAVAVVSAICAITSSATAAAAEAAPSPDGGPSWHHFYNHKHKQKHYERQQELKARIVKNSGMVSCKEAFPIITSPIDNQKIVASNKDNDNTTETNIKVCGRPQKETVKVWCPDRYHLTGVASRISPDILATTSAKPIYSTNWAEGVKVDFNMWFQNGNNLNKVKVTALAFCAKLEKKHEDGYGR